MWRLRQIIDRLVAEDASRYGATMSREERALQLLKANLSAAQLGEYERYRCFEVIGGATGRRYRIRQGHQMNVEQLDTSGRRIRMLCFVPQGRLPVGDVMLAQKAALELFETEALHVARKAPTAELFLDLEPRQARRPP